MALSAWHTGGPSTGWRAGPPSLTHLLYGSVETIWLPILRLHGEGAPSGAEVAITPDGTVPTAGDWLTAVIADGWAGRLLDGSLPVGRHLLVLRFLAPPERVLRGPWLITVLPGPSGEGDPPASGTAEAGYMPGRIPGLIGEPEDDYPPTGGTELEGFMPAYIPAQIGDPPSIGEQ